MSPGEGLSEYAGRGSRGPPRGQLGAKQGAKVGMAPGQAGKACFCLTAERVQVPSTM